jgi:hypothetical protein
MLHSLEIAYHAPVDLEFTLRVETDASGKPNLSITLLQCRPQSHLIETNIEVVPPGLTPKEIVFSTDFMVPQGSIQSVDYVIYVSPKEYFKISTEQERTELAREIGRLNKALAEEKFICVGPGRWGSSNSDLGVPIAYGDIYKSLALIELAGEGCGLPPEPSLGTHFFQDLLESQIYPLALHMDDTHTIFNEAFFDHSANHASDWINANPVFKDCLRLIRVEDYEPNSKIKIVMRNDISHAVGFITTKNK